MTENLKFDDAFGSVRTAHSSSTSGYPSSSETSDNKEQSLVFRNLSNTSWDVDLEDFTKELSCVLCLGLYREPMILPCGHNFCKPCIAEKWFKKGAFTCPECKTRFSEKKDVENKNAVLQKMVEKLRGHQMESAQENCMEHDEPVTLYWKPQRKLACFSCREAQKPKDQSTQFLLIPDAVQIYTERLASMRIQLRSILVEVELLKTVQEEKISNHKENKLHLQYHILSEFLKLHQFLHAKEKLLIKQLTEEGEILLQDMEANLNQLQEQSQQAKTTLRHIQTRLYQQNSSDFLEEIHIFMDWVEKRTEEFSLNELVSRSLSMGHFRGPTQYMVWKEMKSVLRPDISFLTLDPATAHPNLVFSEDLTCVRRDDAKRSLPDTPERFDSRASVLGSKGFASGKHYWEVKVENKTKWTLGVVNESIDRKGNYPLSPKVGHWLIKLRNKVELKAVDMPHRCLTVSSKLHRIGVYLDYDEGQVSFYDAEKQTHLYTFTDNFVEKLYPYFCLCDSNSGENRAPLKIVTFDI